MNKLVVLSALFSAVFAAPSGSLYGAPVPSVYTTHIAAPAPIVPVPSVYSSVVHAPVAPALAVGFKSIPTVYHASSVALEKEIHYAPTPVVTGHTSTIIKPDLGKIATPDHLVTKSLVHAPGRPVETVVPQITRVQPEISVHKVPVDVPVHTPVVTEVELKSAPVSVPVATPVEVPEYRHVPIPAPIVKAPVYVPAPVPATSYIHAPVPVVKSAVVAPVAPALTLTHAAPLIKTAPVLPAIHVPELKTIHAY